MRSAATIGRNRAAQNQPFAFIRPGPDVILSQNRPYGMIGWGVEMDNDSQLTGPLPDQTTAGTRPECQSQGIEQDRLPSTGSTGQDR